MYLMSKAVTQLRFDPVGIANHDRVDVPIREQVMRAAEVDGRGHATGGSDELTATTPAAREPQWTSD
jgi:hypothetical protein